MSKLHIGLIVLVLGLVGCGGTRIAMDPESKDFYETASLIMTKQEKDIFKHQPDKDARREFIRDFWKKRDPDPGTEENEFYEEFFNRIEYAIQHFNEGTLGWKTDRVRIYIYFGPPDRIERRPMMNNVDIKGYQIWIYYRYQFAIEFIDRRGDNSYKMDPYSGVHGSFFDAMERAQMGINFRKDDNFQFMDFDLKFDAETREIRISIPTKDLLFTEEENLLKLELEFQFFIYSTGKDSSRRSFSETRPVAIKESELVNLKNLTFSFPMDLSPGEYYFDVVIIGKAEIGKTRKIFTVKVK